MLLAELCTVKHPSLRFSAAPAFSVQAIHYPSGVNFKYHVVEPHKPACNMQCGMSLIALRHSKAFLDNGVLVQDYYNPL